MRKTVIIWFGIFVTLAFSASGTKVAIGADTDFFGRKRIKLSVDDKLAVVGEPIQVLVETSDGNYDVEINLISAPVNGVVFEKTSALHGEYVTVTFTAVGCYVVTGTAVGYKNGSAFLEALEDDLAKAMKKFTSPPINNSQLSIVWEGDPPHLTVYQFNCHNSVWYAHNGQYIAMNAGPPWPFEAWQIKKQVTQGEDLGQLDRGDIVAYYDKNGNIMHAQICTGNGKETWSANNEPPPPPGTPAQQTWKFAVSEAGKWADNVPNELKPITIKVFKKPNP